MAPSRTAALALLCSRALAFCWECPPGPQFTALEKAAQLVAGAGVQLAIETCVASNARTCTPLPPGDYRFPTSSRSYQLELRNLQRPPSSPLTLDLRGVTFWFTLGALAANATGPVGARSLHLYNCSNIAL